MKIAPRPLGLMIISLSIILIILLGFVKVNSDEQAAALCNVFSEAGESMEDCPAHNNPNSWLFIAAFGITFLVTGVGINLFLPKRSRAHAVNFKEIDLSELDKEEKNIYNNLKENKGSMYQSDLTRKTGFSKVKVSRILDRMEQKDILERKRRGMTNIVVLK